MLLVVTGAGASVVVCAVSVGWDSDSELEVEVWLSVPESCSSVDDDDDDDDVVADVCTVVAGVGVGIDEKVPICRVVCVTTTAVEVWRTVEGDAVVVVLPDGHSCSIRPPDNASPSNEVDGTLASPQTLMRASSIPCSAATQFAEHVFPRVKSVFEQPSMGAL